MPKNRLQFGIRDLLLATTLFSTAVFLDVNLPPWGFFMGAALMGGSYGVLIHRFWRGVFLGLAGAGALVLVSILFLTPRIR